MTRIAAVYMPKGGVGKSFLAGHLATGLAVAGRRVLAIDADPGQGQLSLRFGSVQRRGDLLRLFREGARDEILQQHPKYPNLNLITADPMDVNQFEPLIGAYGPFWPFILKENRLAPWINGPRFDYIIFDCGPGFESRVTACVIQTATELWLPCAVEYESFDSYSNLVNLLLPQARKGPEFITHVIPNKLILGKERTSPAGVTDDDPDDCIRKRAELIRRARTNDSVALLEMLKNTFGSRMTNPVRLAEAVSQKTAGGGETVWESNPDAEVAEDLALVIESIVAQEEVLPRAYR